MVAIYRLLLQFYQFLVFMDLKRKYFPLVYSFLNGIQSLRPDFVIFHSSIIVLRNSPTENDRILEESCQLIKRLSVFISYVDLEYDTRISSKGKILSPNAIGNSRDLHQNRNSLKKWNI